MKFGWWKTYKELPKERRILVRQTALVILFFIVLGIVGAGIYRFEGGAYEPQQIYTGLSSFFGK